MKSDWQPPDIIAKECKAWANFRHDCKRAATKTKPITNQWTKTWTELTKNDEFYLTKADKGGKLVLWRRDDYRKEALRQLNDTEIYQDIQREEVEEALTQLHILKLKVSNDLLLEGNITKSESERIKKEEWEIPAIYFLPKIHKKKREDTNTFTGRPIIGTFKGCLRPLDEFLAEITRPILKQIPGSLQDTRDLLIDLQKLKGLPEDAILFSADVEALYPSIPWREGIQAATWLYSTNFYVIKQEALNENRLPPPNPKTFKKILELVICKNYFHFQGTKWYHQKKGTAMGCSISVYFANAFMLWKTKHLIDNPPKNLLYMGRYIDDIIGVYRGREDDISELFNNVVDNNIRLTFVINPPKLEALDLLIWKENGSLKTSLFRKPTDGHQYLHWDSCHPVALKKSIPYSQLLRIKRNCSEQEDYEREASFLLDRFKRRHYPKDVLNRAKEQADARTRSELLSKIESTDNEVSTTHTLVVKFHPDTEENIKQALRKLKMNLNTTIPEQDQFRIAFALTEALNDSIGPAFKKGDGIQQFGRKDAIHRILRTASARLEELTKDNTIL